MSHTSLCLEKKSSLVENRKANAKKKGRIDHEIIKLLKILVLQI